MKIHGTAKGGAESKKDFGVAFGKDEEPSGCENFEDSMGTDANGSVSGASIAGSGKFDDCISFDGVNDFVNIDGIASDDAFSTNVGAISFWVKVNSPSVTDRTHFAFGDTNANTYLKVSNDGTLIQWSLRDITKSPSIQWEGRKTGGLPNNTWTNIIINQDGTEVDVYINNDNDVTWNSEEDMTAWVIPAMNNFRLGCRNYNSSANAGFFEGFIDDFVIFNTALTSDQREFLQSNPASSLTNCDGIRAYYNCNQLDNSTLTNNAMPIE